MRRTEHALVRGDARMLDDPLAAQSISLVIGAVLAVVAVAVVTVLAVLRPAGDPGDAPILLVRDSGAMYVRIDDRVHPVFNLASARLITGSPAEPRIVSQQAIDRALRGPMVGIPDAPPHLAPPLADGQWTVCDDARSELTTVIAGAVPRDLADGHSVLVTAREEPAATYLLYGAWRARVDLRHPAVVRALRLDGLVPQPVSPLLLAAIPEAPAIEPPLVARIDKALLRENRRTDQAAQGSNAWTVAASRTDTGRPILANDPHLAIGGFSPRHIVHLTAPGLDVIGAGYPGLPGIMQGHTDRFAFGRTNFHIDQSDLFVLETHPDDPTLYRHGGAWKPFDVVEEVIAVKGGAPQRIVLRYCEGRPVIAEGWHHRLPRGAQ